MTTPPTALPRGIEYLPLDELRPNPRNPKEHDLETLDGSVGRFGYIDPIVRDDRTGYIVSGHGRTKTLRAMRDRGEDVPEGITVDEAGQWLVPVGVGWASRTDTEAAAALIALNRTTELGGWVDDSLLELLDELGQVDGGLTGVGFADDDIDDLRARLTDLGGEDSHRDTIEDGKKRGPRVRDLPLDLILSLTGGPSFAEGQMGIRLGWRPGVMTSGASGARSYYERFPKAEQLAFMDNEWKDYDHAAHVAALSEFHPKYATTRDLLTREQARDAGVTYYTVEETLEMAEEVAEHCDNVILIPKWECLDKLPEHINGTRVVLGYSVPSSYGGTRLPAEAFAGRPVHLLGGPWSAQRAYLSVLGDDVVSLDNNHLMNIARFGQVCMADGSVQTIDDLIGIHLGRSMFPAMVLSLANIATAIATDFGVTLPPDKATGDEAWDSVADATHLYHDRDGEVPAS